VEKTATIARQTWCRAIFCPSGIHSTLETSYNKEMFCPVRWLHLFVMLLSGSLLYIKLRDDSSSLNPRLYP